MATTKYLSISDAEQFIAKALVANEVPSADALIVAQLMVKSDLVGADGHGLFRLPAYLKRIRAGGVNLKPNIRIEREKGATALINGDNALGHLVMNKAVEVAIEKVKEHSVCWVGSHYGNHSGAASVYVRKLAEQGFIGIYMAVGNAITWPLGAESICFYQPIQLRLRCQRAMDLQCFWI